MPIGPRIREEDHRRGSGEVIAIREATASREVICLRQPLLVRLTSQRGESGGQHRMSTQLINQVTSGKNGERHISRRRSILPTNCQ